MATGITHADTRREMQQMFAALGVLEQAVTLKREGLLSVGGGETQTSMAQRDIARLRADREYGEGVLAGADAIYLPIAAEQARAGGIREVAENKAHNQ